MTTILLALLLAMSAMMSTAQTTSGSRPLALTNARVVDVAVGTVRPASTVLIEGERIVAVADVEVPTDAEVIDVDGAFVIPGLWDMHVHSSSDRITREVFLPLYIANGVTGVRDLTGDCFAPCSPLESSIDEARRWREEIREGRLVGPRIVSSSPIIHGPGPGEPSSAEAPATEEHGRALARLMAERGVDFIKVYDELPREAFFGLVHEATRLGLPVVGHVPLGVSVPEAAEAGMRSMEHLFPVIDACSSREEELRPQQVRAVREGDVRLLYENLYRNLAAFSAEKCAGVYEAVAAQETWQVPTLVAQEAAERGVGWRDDPRMAYVPSEERDYWLRSLAEEALVTPGGLSSLPVITERLRGITVDMFRAGVPVLAGSDTGSRGVFPGFSLHKELEALVRAGLTPAEALRAATLAPAEYLGAADSLGTVEAGKAADLVLLDANPLEDIQNTKRIRAVVARGRYLDRDALDAVLAEVEHAVRE